MKYVLDTPYGEIIYELKLSSRARHIRLEIRPGGKIIAVLPRFVSRRTLEKFIAKKAAWIIKRRAAFKNKSESGLNNIPPAVARQQYLKYKETARVFVKSRLDYLNGFYGFTFKKISIRDQKTRWGSCSRAGNLNFNYKIIFLSSELADYLIVHELCHLRELNHSVRFWRLVAKTVPDYKKRRQELHNQDFATWLL